MMFAAATAALVVAMLMALLRALLGPTVYDRVLAVNAFGTKTMLMIAVLGFLAGRGSRALFWSGRCFMR